MRALRYDGVEEEEEGSEFPAPVASTRRASSSFDDDDGDDDDEGEEEGEEEEEDEHDDEEALLLANEGMDLLYGIPEEEDDDDEDGPASSLPSTSLLPPSPAEGGDQRAYIDAVIAAGGPTRPKDAAAMFPHPLDRFQRRALRAALAGRDVVVCAPTGAGKTAIAAAAALGVLASGRRVVYTTPLKALSNQKLAELRALFGETKVGLQTGDATINPGAPVVVMTTEVLRNILLRVASGKEEEELGRRAAAAALAAEVDAAAVLSSSSDAEEAEPARASSSPPRPPAPSPAAPTADVGLIVLDEVHYLGDPTRGTTWEEVIMSCPAGASLLAMSATVRNPGDLGAWIGAVHGRRGGAVSGGGGGGASSGGAPATAETIVTSSRPVPLTWMYAWSTPPWLRQQQQGYERERGGELGEEEEGGAKEEPRKSSVRIADLLAPLPPGVVGPGGSGGGAASSSPAFSSQRPARLRLSAALRPRYSGGAEEPRAQPAPVPLACELERRGLLPAIWFVFSRAGCDATATAIGKSRGAGGDENNGGKRGKGGGKARGGTPRAATVIGLDGGEGEGEGRGGGEGPIGTGPPSPEKLAEIDAALAALGRDQPEALRPDMVPALRAGVASHHAGCLPGWKQLVEGLFQRGCLDVVVATETLAAGINMPARTTVISSLQRRRGPRGVEPLTHNELLQMAGRAGRRGFDSEGACVLLHECLYSLLAEFLELRRREVCDFVECPEHAHILAVDERREPVVF